MKKNMTDTLEAFRNEWTERPDERSANISWVDMALKLHLPDMMRDSPFDTVVENMASSLVQESSVRMRKAPDVIVSGLAEKPRAATVPLPPLQSASASDDDNFERLNSCQETEEITLQKIKHRGTQISSKYSVAASRQQSEKSTYRPTLPKGKHSSENWIPEQTRFRSIHRDIANLKENLRSTMVLETEQQREMRRFQLTDIQRARVEEELGTKKKGRCACCLQEYSQVNLVMTIPVKAVIDIRKKWSEGKGGWWDKDDARLSAIPRCYEGAGVCRFCSQFFHQQEEYRPSFDTIAYEERKAQFFETKRLEREYWDPLKMVEKDRAEAEEKGIPDGSVFLPFDGSISSPLTKGLTTIDYE